MSLQGFLDQRVETVGKAITVTPRLGIEGEPLRDRLTLRVGTYVEPSRYEEGTPRQHFTFGGDVRLFPIDFWGLFRARTGSSASWSTWRRATRTTASASATGTRLNHRARSSISLGGIKPPGRQKTPGERGSFRGSRTTRQSSNSISVYLATLASSGVLVVFRDVENHVQLRRAALVDRALVGGRPSRKTAVTSRSRAVPSSPSMLSSAPAARSTLRW